MKNLTTQQAVSFAATIFKEHVTFINNESKIIKTIKKLFNNNSLANSENSQLTKITETITKLSATWDLDPYTIVIGGVYFLRLRQKCHNVNVSVHDREERFQCAYCKITGAKFPYGKFHDVDEAIRQFTTCCMIAAKWHQDRNWKNRRFFVTLFTASHSIYKCLDCFNAAERFVCNQLDYNFNCSSTFLQDFVTASDRKSRSSIAERMSLDDIPLFDAQNTNLDMLLTSIHAF